MLDGGPLAGAWEMHSDFTFPSWGISVPALVHDVNGDGVPDIILGNGHGYGLWWMEQKVENGRRSFTTHVIDSSWAQYHDIHLCDIDGDGQPELLTGKRYKAHNGNDAGDCDDVFVCYYKLKNGVFVRHVIDVGAPEDGHSGVGIYFETADLSGTGRPDIVAPGKEGLYLFKNMGV